MKNGELRYYVELLVAMTQKELRARYKYTLFGFFWLIANPLLQMLIISFVFRFFLKSQIQHYELYLLLNLLIWSFFSLSLTKATPSIVWERNLIKKTAFPRSVIPLSIVLSNVIHLVTAMVLYYILILFTGNGAVYKLPITILAFVLLFSYTSGLCLLTAALNVRFRDVSFFVQALLVVWFYATPIVYTLSMIPYRFYWLWRLNPLTSILQLLQNAAMDKPLPGIGMFSINSFVIGITIVVGALYFRRTSRYFDDWV